MSSGHVEMTKLRAADNRGGVELGLAPQSSHASGDVDSRALAWAARSGALRTDGPIRAIEQR
jgi:hypothetical protein